MDFKMAKYISFMVVFVFLSPVSILANPYVESSPNFEDLQFKQEIKLTIDTSQPEAKFQPIDIRINFNNPCWAKNEKHHSIRVGFDDRAEINEIESQIYDLEYVDTTHISSCSLVFLIPKEADGTEKYYVLYDNSEIPVHKYPDHLQVEDSHYFCEPISGAKVDFNYYKITEDEYIVYIISYEGELFENGISQVVAKLKPNSKIVETQTLEQLASYTMLYSIDGENPDYAGSSWAKNPSKSVLIDGNLMVKIRIKSFSPDRVIKTDNIYTYYYCPSSVKRISVNTDHEVLKTVEIRGSTLLDGTYTNLVIFKSRSATVDKLNIGSIYPSIHVYEEDDTIQSFSVPPDPTSNVDEIVLSKNDDIDLGHKGWFCIDDPSTKKTHGIIFKETTNLVEGEEDGVQIKALVEQNIKLPGLEVDVGQVYATANTNERGRDEKQFLYKGFNVSFDSEFITFEKEGYDAVDKESEIYQELASQRPTANIDIEEEGPQESYNLDTYVHFGYSFPLGNLFSIATGKNFSYISVELFKNNSLNSLGCVGRIPLCSTDLNLDGKNILQKIKAIVNLFDWRNTSFYKKIFFPDIEPGTYIIKIYRDNPFFAEDRQYIGLAIVEISADTSTHIFCRSQGIVNLSVVDQNEKGIENVEFLLEMNDMVIADAVSDRGGNAVLYAPCFPNKPYVLKIFYNDFLVEEKELTLKLKNHFIQFHESFSFERYDMHVEIRDTWDLPFSVELNPWITSDDMVESSRIYGELLGAGEYIFSDLYPSDYVLKIGYKSFELEKEISIKKDEMLNLFFPVEYKLNFDVMDSFGNLLPDGELRISRNDKTERIKISENGRIATMVPPGEYGILVVNNDEDIAKQSVNVKAAKTVQIITSKDSVFHNIVFYLGVLFAICCIVFMIWKRKITAGLKLFAVALLIISLVSPGWMLTGEQGNIETYSKVMLVPPKIVTLTSFSDGFGGEISVVPSEATTLLEILSFVLLMICIFVFLSVIIKNKFKKTSYILTVFSIVLLIFLVIIFYYLISLLTEIGVGSFIGSGNIEITTPGVIENIVMHCSWGPSVGFYLTIIAAIILVIDPLYEKFYSKKAKQLD